MKKQLLFEITTFFFRKKVFRISAIAIFCFLAAQVVFAKQNGIFSNDLMFSKTAKDPTNVVLTDNGATVVLDNGIVKVTVNKTNAVITSLIYNGLELIKGGFRGGEYLLELEYAKLSKSICMYLFINYRSR